MITKSNKIEEEDFFIGQTIFNKYKLIRKLGEGSFGTIYESQSFYSNKLYAIKLEDMKRNHFILEEESVFLSYLNIPGVPKFKSFGYSGSFIILVMELLGKSLDKIIEELPNERMSIRCVCNIAYQLITILEIIHNCDLIHNDIKPGNVAIGIEEKSKYIYLLDFGLSKKYRSSKTKKHFPYVKNNKMIGNIRFSSINALNGFTQSRRDDLESLGYLLIFLILGQLPWQGYISQNKEEKLNIIKKIKQNTTPKELCKDLPYIFEEYMKYSRNLKYEDDPDYKYLKQLFVNFLNSYNFKIDYYYDWDQLVLDDTQIKNKEKENNDLNNTIVSQHKIPDICNKISNLIIERQKLGGIFDNYRFAFNIDEESNFNKSNNKSISQNNETDFERYNYSNSMAPYTNWNKNVKHNRCPTCQNKNNCCLIV